MGAQKTSSTNWVVEPLRYSIASISSGTSVNAIDVPAGEGEIGVLKTSCVYSGRFDPAQNKAVVLEELGRVSCPVLRGSIIVSRMNTPDLVGAAGLVTEEVEGIYLPDRLWQVRISRGSPAFFYYWMQSPEYRAQVQMASDGASSSMQNLALDQFKHLRLAVPPLSEQAAIPAFLDRETSKIDALVAEQKRLIELLKEKRQAVISHAVTKGLDPNVRMKPSGVEWLGDVPEHWEVTRLKFVASVQTGTAKGKDISGQETISVPYLRVANVQDGHVDLSEIAEIEVPVRRQKLWRRRASALAESSARHRVDVMWRCGHAASADVGWFCV